MTLSVLHSYVSTIPDDTNPDTVSPSDWNDEHELIVGAASLLGAAAAGPVVELTPTQARTILNVEDGATNDQTAAEILAALLTVDGAGSGLDADLLDGNSSAFFSPASVSGTAAAILTSLLTVDGAGSGLDADLLDGISSAAFGLVANPLSQFAEGGNVSIGGVRADYTGTLGTYYGFALSDGTPLFSGRGTSSSPVTGGAAPIVGVLHSNDATATGLKNPSAIAGISYKYTTTSSARAAGVYGEGRDTVGGAGSFVEGGRLVGHKVAGTGGSAYGAIGFAQAAASGTSEYIIGFEGEVIRGESDAPVPSSFSTSQFMAHFLATTRSGNKPDAAFMTNPFSAVAARVGFGVYGNTVDHTAFRNAASLVYGLDLQPGTYSGAAARFPNAGQVHWRNQANDTDLQIFQLDTGNNFNVGVAALSTTFWTNNTIRAAFGASAFVFNDAGNDYDFRMEGDTNANLFFLDASTDRIGIGTATPLAVFDLNFNAASVTPTSGSIAQFVNVDASNTIFELTAFGTSVSAGVNARSARGTGGTPTNSQANDQLGALACFGYGDGWPASSKAKIAAFASENWSSTAQGTYIGFFNTQPTTTTRIETLRTDRPTTATHTALLVYDVDNNTLERVSVGAAGSGGTGFKVLRIPD